MNSNLFPDPHQYGGDFGRLWKRMAFGISIVGLVLVLFWLGSDSAQASSCGNSPTVRSGGSTGTVTRGRNSASATSSSCRTSGSDQLRRNESSGVAEQSDPPTRGDSRYNRGGTSGGRSRVPAGSTGSSSGSNNGSGSGSDSSSDQNPSSNSGRTRPSAATRRN